MEHRYHITVFDNFHLHEPDSSWVSGTFATAEAAIAVVRRQIDAELIYLLAEIRKQDNGLSSVDRLISQYNSFAEMPFAFNQKGEMIFDSTAYMMIRASSMFSETPDEHGPEEPQPCARTRPPIDQEAAKEKPRLSRLKAIWMALSRPRPPAVLWAGVLIFCILCGLLRLALR